MNRPSQNRWRSALRQRESVSGGIWMPLMMVVCFLAGVAVGVFWLQHPRDSTPAANQSRSPGEAAPQAADGSNGAANSNAAAQSPAAATIAKADSAALAEVKRLIPNLDAVSLKEATKILRAAALKDFEAAAKQMDAQVSNAQEQLRQTQQDQSEAEQQAAMKHLQQVESDQADALKQIAARLEAELEAMRRQKQR